MFNIVTENAPIKKSITNLTKIIMDFSIKIIGLYVQKTEEKKLKSTIKKLKKNVSVTKNSKLKGYGQKRYKECKKIFNNYCNKTKSLLKGLRGSNLTEEDVKFYRRKADEIMNDYHKEINKLHEETDKMLKEYCVLSLETISEVEYDLERFKDNVDDLATIGIDTVDDIFLLSYSNDNSFFDSFCQRISFRIVTETEKIITEYVSYPNRLLQFFDKFTN